MKKIVLTLVALLSMNLAYAGTGMAAPADEAKVYDMSVNYKKLGMCLGLDYDQMDAVQMIHKREGCDARSALHARRA